MKITYLFGLFPSFNGIVQAREIPRPCSGNEITKEACSRTFAQKTYRGGRGEGLEFTYWLTLEKDKREMTTW